MLSKPLNKGEFCGTQVAYWLALIHSIDVQTNNLISMLPTKTHHMHHPASRTSFSDTIMSSRKIAVVLKLRKVIFAGFFTSRQNKMLVSPPAAYGTYRKYLH